MAEISGNHILDIGIDFGSGNFKFAIGGVPKKPVNNFLVTFLKNIFYFKNAAESMKDKQGAIFFNNVKSILSLSDDEKIKIPVLFMYITQLLRDSNLIDLIIEELDQNKKNKEEPLKEKLSFNFNMNLTPDEMNLLTYIFKECLKYICFEKKTKKY